MADDPQAAFPPSRDERIKAFSERIEMLCGHIPMLLAADNLRLARLYALEVNQLIYLLDEPE